MTHDDMLRRIAIGEWSNLTQADMASLEQAGLVTLTMAGGPAPFRPFLTEAGCQRLKNTRCAKA